MRLALALLSASATLSGLALGVEVVAEDVSADKFRYRYSMQLVAEEFSLAEITIDEDERWATLRAYPARVTRLRGPVLLDADEYAGSIAAGDMVVMGESDVIFGCKHETESRYLTGTKRPCFADFDRDGSFESVFMNADTPILDRHVQEEEVASFFRIDPVPYEQVTDLAELREAGLTMPYYLRQRGRNVRVCQGEIPNFNNETCLRDRVRIDDSDDLQRVEFLGGVFWVQRLEHNQISVRIERMIEPQNL